MVGSLKALVRNMNLGFNESSSQDTSITMQYLCDQRLLTTPSQCNNSRSIRRASFMVSGSYEARASKCTQFLELVAPACRKTSAALISVCEDGEHSHVVVSYSKRGQTCTSQTISCYHTKAITADRWRWSESPTASLIKVSWGVTRWKRNRTPSFMSSLLGGLLFDGVGQISIH